MALVISWGLSVRYLYYVTLLALAVYYAAYLLVQPLMNVVRCSLFNIAIIG